MTGWTRAHYQAIFARLLVGFVEHRSPEGARTRYPGGEHMPAAMEGAIRMLPALGAWLACDCNPERVIVEGRELDVLAIAREIIVSGTDPRSRDYWRPISHGWDQRQVEAAAVAEFLVRTKAKIWARLDAQEQAQVMAWLRPAEEPLAANWLALQITRNTARAALDLPYPEDALREQLDRIEADYVGDGFYRDGYAHRFDWYNGLVTHAELSFWRATLGAREPERAARLAARTRAYLGQLPYLMDKEGRVAPIGRSLGYRSAVLAGLEASVLAGDTFMAPGLARRMCSGSLRYFEEAELFDADATLTIGYQGDQPRVAEAYLRPGSQYYLTRALQVLALPPEHPFWAEIEQPLPADLGDFMRALPGPGWMLDHDRAIDRREPQARAGAGLILHNARSSTEKASYYARYKKLGYGAWQWFAGRSEGRESYDSLVVSASEGRFTRRRSAPQAWSVAPGFAWLRYAMAPEAEVDPGGLIDDDDALGEGSEPSGGDPDAPPADWHFISTAALTAMPGRADPAGARPIVRLSCVEASSVEVARPYAGSFAIAHGEGAVRLGGGAQLWRYIESGPRDPWAKGAVLLAGLVGWGRAGINLDFPASPAHVLVDDAAFVGLGLAKGDPGVAPGTRRCFASLEQSSERDFPPAEVLASTPAVVFDGSEARVEWPAGGWTWVELGEDVGERTLVLRVDAAAPKEPDASADDGRAPAEGSERDLPGEASGSQGSSSSSLERAGLRASGPLRMVWVSEGDDPIEFVAVGLRSLSDANGPILAAIGDAPLGLVACHGDGEDWRCEADGPLRLRVDSGEDTAELRLRESGWWGVGGATLEAKAEVPVREGVIRVEPRAHGLGPGARETTTVMFDVRG
nr:DUF2264 domain-containing protein [Pseudenhygromyxa sp. WMMC2535]